MRKMTNIFILFIFIILFTYISSFHQVEAMGKISEGSGVATIELDNLSREEAEQVLQEAVIEWKTAGPLIAESDYEILEIPRDLFVFHIDDTLDKLDERMKRTVSSLFRKPKDIMIPFEVTIDTERQSEFDWPTYIDVEKTIDKFLFSVSHLKNGKVVLEYEDETRMEEVVLAEVIYTMPENFQPTIVRITEELDETIIQSETVFSFLEEAMLPNGISDTDDEMTFVASAIYELALHTKMEIVERHQSELIPTFTEAGLEAAIDQDADKNLLIYNPASYSFTIHAETSEDEMRMSISTIKQKKPNSFVRENQKEIEPRTVYRYSDELLPGQEVVQVDGRPGLQLEVYKERQGESDEPDREFISRDFYAPEHRIVLVSSTEEEVREEEMTPSTEEVTDFFSEDLTNDVVEDRMKLALQCDGNPECEEELGVSTIDRMIASCFVGDLFDVEGSEDSVQPELHTNSFCDLIQIIFFLGLFNEQEEGNEDVLLQEDWEMVNEEVEADEKPEVTNDVSDEVVK